MFFRFYLNSTFSRTVPAKGEYISEAALTDSKNTSIHFQILNYLTFTYI